MGLVVAAATLVVGAPAGASAAPATVEIIDNGFTPGEVTVGAGEAVTWRQTGQSVHDVTARDGSFSSGYTYSGSTFSHTFASPGSYGYYCSIHPAMTGTVVVQPAAPPPSPTPTPTTPPPAPSPTPTPAPTTAPPAPEPEPEPEPEPTTAAPAPTPTAEPSPTATETTGTETASPSASPTPTPSETTTSASPTPSETETLEVVAEDVASGNGRGWLVALLVLAIVVAAVGGTLVVRHRRGAA